MKALEVLIGILAGGIFITWILYLAVRCLKSGRNEADRNRQIYDNEFGNRYRSPKP